MDYGSNCKDILGKQVRYIVDDADEFGDIGNAKPTDIAYVTGDSKFYIVGADGQFKEIVMGSGGGGGGGSTGSRKYLAVQIDSSGSITTAAGIMAISLSDGMIPDKPAGFLYAGVVDSDFMYAFDADTRYLAMYFGGDPEYSSASGYAAQVTHCSDDIEDDVESAPSDVAFCFNDTMAVIDVSKLPHGAFTVDGTTGQPSTNITIRINTNK